MEQLPLAFRLQPSPDFDSFVVGANGPAVAQLRALAPGAPPVYLWGPSGSGKTHLLRAAARQWQAAGCELLWCDAARELPWPDVAAGGLVVLDDCDAYDPPRQHAAFALFVEAAGGGLAILAAGNAPPVDLPLREDLRSRLGWGPVFALQPLGEADIRAALREEATRRGLRLPEDMIDYLLTRFERNLKSLAGLLEALDAYALRHQRPLTLPLLRQMLAEATP